MDTKAGRQAEEGSSAKSPAHPSATPAAVDHQRLLLAHRFGKYSSAVIILGTPVSSACIAFVCFLWLGDEKNPTWRQIIVSGWATRCVTITALVIRVAVSAQAAVATSMVAALLLQTGQTRLSSAAAVSLATYSNDGPRSLLFHLPRKQQATRMGRWMTAIVWLMASISLAV